MFIILTLSNLEVILEGATRPLEAVSVEKPAWG